MKSLLLITVLGFFTMNMMTAQEVPALELTLKYGEWHQVDTKDEFGDIDGGYDVFIEMADCTSSTNENYNIAIRITRAKDNDHQITFWSDIKANEPFSFPYALFPDIKVKRENGTIETHEIPMMSDGKITILHHNPLGQLLNNGTGEQVKILIDFSDEKSLLEKCLIPMTTH